MTWTALHLGGDVATLFAASALSFLAGLGVGLAPAVRRRTAAVRDRLVGRSSAPRDEPR